MKLFTSFPTVVFTFLLAVCLIWWLMSLLLSGLDIDADTDADADGLSEALGFGTMPFPLALTLLAFGGWVTTAVLQRLIAPGDFVLGAAAAIGVLLAACVGGLLLLRLLANPMGKLFAIESAPSLARAVGSVCKVRTVGVSERFGDAEVVTGPVRGSIISVRAADGRFTRGDLCLVIAYDEATNSFVIDEIDELVRPD